MFASFKAEGIDDKGDFPCTLKIQMEISLAKQLSQALCSMLDERGAGTHDAVVFYLAGQPIIIEGLGYVSDWQKDIEIVNMLSVYSDAPLMAAQIANRLSMRERHNGFRRHEELERIARNARFFADALEREAEVLKEEGERGALVK